MLGLGFGRRGGGGGSCSQRQENAVEARRTKSVVPWTEFEFESEFDEDPPEESGAKVSMHGTTFSSRTVHAWEPHLDPWAWRRERIAWEVASETTDLGSWVDQSAIPSRMTTQKGSNGIGSLEEEVEVEEDVVQGRSCVSCTLVEMCSTSLMARDPAACSKRRMVRSGLWKKQWKNLDSSSAPVRPSQISSNDPLTGQEGKTIKA